MGSSTRLHPWNRDFAWKSRSCTTPRRLSEEQLGQYDAQGFTVLEDAIEADELAALIEEIDPVEARLTAFLADQPGRRIFIADADAITFSTHLVLQSERLRAFCAGPLFRDLVRELVGDDVRLYWDQAVYKKPNPERVFPWHQDNGYTYVDPQQYLTCWIALTDATPENGCPWVVPGMHRMGTLEHRWTDDGWQCLEEPEGAVAVPVRAGSIAIFSSLTPHRTGPNRSGATRKAYIVQFAPDGAVVLSKDEKTGKCSRVRQNDPKRQFPTPPPLPPLNAPSSSAGRL